MNSKRILLSSFTRFLRELTAVLCVGLMLQAGNAFALGGAPQTSGGDQQQGGMLSAQQLDSLVAPIALYPDPMLTNVLMASTYPLEIVQLQQWLGQNKNLKDKALADAVEKQGWDPSVQSLAGLPDLVKQLADNIKWTTDLGNAVLAQQDDVMAAVQRMRKTAQDKGNLKSSEQMKVETKTVESQPVIIIEQANPQVVYVPSYNPTVVYGAPVYPYPPIYYPPPGYYAAGMAISFGVGVAMGAFWGGGGWCCGCGWGSHNTNIYINNNNNFVNHYNRTNNINNVNRGNSNWQHNPSHRGGAPYSNSNIANKYGGTARGDSLQSRQNNARQNQARQQGGAGTRDVSNRGGASAGTRDVSNRGGANAGNRSNASAGNMSANRGGGGADRVGNQRVPSSPSSTNRSAFGGSNMSGSGARASQSRGASSMGGGGRSSGGARSGGGGRRR